MQLALCAWKVLHPRSNQLQIKNIRKKYYEHAYDKQTMFVLAPYFRHRVYTVLDMIGSQRRLECTGWMQTLYARYKGPECSWSLVPTGVSGISLPKDGSLKMMPNTHQPVPRKATASFAQQQATYTTKYRPCTFHGTRMHNHYLQQSKVSSPRPAW